MMLPGPDSARSAPQYNIHESPAVYFKEAIREIRSRLKLCELYSYFFDDIANIEDMYGKLIVKIGTNQRMGKDDWPIETTRLLEQLHTSTEKAGKQHIGYSLCVSQSISREFFEYAKSTTRKIHDLELKMQSSAEDITKNSKLWKKKYSKYIRLIQDAEGSIVARDAAIREYAEKINSTHTEEGFFNRSITMVLGKAPQNDAMKKQHDKCRSLVHELDLMEAELTDLTSVLRQQQEAFNTSLASTLREIEITEEERLNFIKNGLLRFYQANTGMSDHLTQIFDHLKGLISALDIHVDIEAFERELEVAKSSFKEVSLPPTMNSATVGKSSEVPPPTDNSATYPSSPQTSEILISSATDNHPRIDDDESLRHLKLNLMVFERLKEGIECIKKLAQRATGTFADISDAEKNYSKTTLKVLEKHGYSSGGSTSNMISTSFASTDPKLRDLVNLYESSFCHSGWNNITQLTEKLSEAHLTVAEVLLDKCCVITDNAQRKMDTLVKEGNEKVHQVNKKIEGARAAQMRLKSKLNRVQKELKDRRMIANSPRKTKDELSESTSHAQNEIDDLSSDSTHQKSHDVIEQAPSSQPVIPGIQKQKSEKGMIQGWESLGNAFGAVAVTALGAAGVLESSTERNNNRIANLEEEEAACIESLGTASTSTQVVTDLCVNDLSAIIMSLKQGLSKEMENFKTSLLLFIDGHTVGLNISINVLARLKYVTDAIDIQQDILHFHSNIVVASLANEERKVPNLFFLPPIEEFVRIKNDLVDLERQNEKESQFVDSNIVVSSPGAVEQRKSFQTPLRQRSRGNSSCDESLLTSTSDSVPIDEHLAESGDIIRSPENFSSDEIEIRLSIEDSVNFSKKEMLPTMTYSSRLDNNMSPPPLVAPSECSVPDYDEETIQNLKGASQNYKKDGRVESPPSAEKLIESNSNSIEIGTFVGSSEEGLRRSVTTERHSTSPQDDESIPRQVMIPQREENWTSPELAKFDLPPTEKVLEYFSCALYPKRGLLTHGKLFITNHYLAFSGWPETRVIIELQHIENVEKKQVFFIPNALSVNSHGEEYFFGSFLDRDLCYRMLTSMVMIAKSLNEITSDSTSQTLSEKHRKSSFRVHPEESNVILENNEPDSSNNEPEEFDDGTDYDLSKLPDYLGLFVAASVSCVYEVSTPLAASLIWRICWQEKTHFTDFLSSVGDFDIGATDWIPFSSTLTKSQDPLNLKFQYKRTVDYLHPRTSMLMFGPKNATAKQVQYLYLPELELHSSGASVDLSSVRRIRSGCILCATQFEGIPMSDVFEVLQYWTFQKLAPDKTVIRAGVTVNFLKGTLVKGQILSGTKEELTVLSKQWCDYSIQSIEKYLQNRQTNTANLTDESTHSTATRRKSATKPPEEFQVQVPSTSPPSVIPIPNREDITRIERYSLFFCAFLAIILLIQTLFLYLMYRRMVFLDQNFSDLKSLLNSSIASSSNHAEYSCNLNSS